MLLLCFFFARGTDTRIFFLFATLYSVLGRITGIFFSAVHLQICVYAPYIRNIFPFRNASLKSFVTIVRSHSLTLFVIVAFRPLVVS